MFRTIERYEDGSLGLPYAVTLINGAEEEIDNTTGERVGVSVRHLEDLIAAVAVARALCPLQLDGKEVRFIRRAIGRTAKDFAEWLGLDPATFSRWENGKQSVGDWAEKQVRMAAIIMFGDRVPGLALDQKAIINLRVRPRQPGDELHLEMELVSSEAGRGDEEAWDMKLAA